MSPSERAAVDQAHRQFGEPTATPKPRAGEHTKGPWMHTELGTVIAGKTRYIVCEHAGLEDARRIVACVNACEGISDPVAYIAVARNLADDSLLVVADNDALREQVAFLERFADAPDMETGKTTRDLLRERERALVEALEELVTRCDGEEGVRADGSNIQTMRAHAFLEKAGK